MGVLSLTRMVVDIFPTIDIPVVAVVWNYPGLSARGHGAARRAHQRARLLDDGQRHRAHRVAVDPRHRPPARSTSSRAPTSARPSPRSRRCRRRILRITPPGMHAAQRHPVQRLQRPGRAADRRRARRCPSSRSSTTASTSSACGCSPSPACRRRRRSAASSARSTSTSTRRRSPPRGCRPADVVNALAASNVILPAGHRAHRRPRVQRAHELSPPSAVEQFTKIPVKVVGGAPVLLGDVAPCRRRLRRPDQHRARQRQARHLPGHPQARRRLDAGGGRRRRGTSLPQHQGGGARRARAQDRLRPVAVRARRHQRASLREAIISSLLVSLMIGALPRQLAQHGHRLHLDPARHLLRRIIGLNLYRPHHQHHDAGRPGAGHRHAGRRRHRRGREHPPQPRPGQAAHRGHPRRRAPDRRRRPSWPRSPICIVFFPVVLLVGPAQVPLRAAGARGRAGDAGLVPAVADAGADAGAHADGAASTTASPAPTPAAGRRLALALQPGGATAASSASRTATAASSSTLLHHRLFTIVVALVVGCHLARAGLRRRHRLLPAGRRRPDEAALPRARRARASRRPRSWCAQVEEQHPRRSSRPRELETHQRHDRRADLLQPGLRADRQRRRHGRRDPDRAQAGAPPDRAATCSGSATALAEDFPGCSVYFQPADIVSQVLNFGLSAPIDVQVEDADLAEGRTRSRARLRDEHAAACPAPPTCTSRRCSTTRRSRSTSTASARRSSGSPQRDVANNLLISLSSSGAGGAVVLPEPAQQRQLLVVVKTPLPKLRSVAEPAGDAADAAAALGAAAAGGGAVARRRCPRRRRRRSSSIAGRCRGGQRRADQPLHRAARARRRRQRRGARPRRRWPPTSRSKIDAARQAAARACGSPCAGRTRS